MGVRIKGEAGAGGGVEGRGGGIVGGGTVEGVAAGVEGNAGVGEVCGFAGNFSGAGSGGGEILSFGLGSFFGGSIVDFCWRYGGIPDPDGEVTGAGLLAAAGVNEGAFSGSGNGGVGGDGGAAADIAGGSGDFGVSIPPIGRIIAGAGLFAACCFFVASEAGCGGEDDAVFLSFAGAAGAAPCLFSPDPLENLPHSPAPFTGGEVGVVSTG